MAAVAMAESSGVVSAVHTNANNSVDYGLWQINSIHGYNPSLLTSDPTYNAKAAVAVFNSSGPGAWTTYKDGAYKTYMPGGKNAPNIADPVPDAKFGRIDQGVDYVSASNVRALVAGKITGIVPFATGEGVASETAIMEKFDAPVSYGGRTYYGGYYAEEKPLVSQGQHVQAGQQIMGSGSDEIGFLVNQGTQFPQLIGTKGSGTLPSPEGRDYAGMVAGIGGPQPPAGSAPGWENAVIKVGQTLSNPLAGNPILGVADAAVGAAGGLNIPNPLSAFQSDIESIIIRGFFILIGIGLCLVGLALIAWTVMGKVGAPGAVGMVQSQMRINQAGARTQESQRASMVRESQAEARLGEQQEARKLRERRLNVREEGVKRSGFEDRRFTNVRRDDRTASRKKPGRKVSGVPKRNT